MRPKIGISGGLLLFSAIGAAAVPSRPDPSQLLHSVPLRFEQDSHLRWTTRGPGFAVLFAADATIFRFSGRSLQLNFQGSNSTAEFRALQPFQTQTNYFVGKQFHAVDGFARLERSGIYAGIDAVYYGDGQQLEYDFNLQPGADPSQIRMRFEGADSVSVNADGDIVLKLGTGDLVQKAPVVYQRRSTGEVVAVESRYRMLEGGEIGVVLGAYDRGAAVVIDPAVLYSLYLTGTNADAAVAIKVDRQGFVYLGGYTYSTDFPLGNNGYQLFPESTNRNGWIWKLNPSAPPNQELVYSTYFAANLDVDLRSLDVDANGRVYFGGTTLASDLPVTSGAFQAALANTNATNEGFVAIIDTTQAGTAGLIYCSYFGGSQITTINSVATRGGDIYVTGWINSNDLPLAGNSFQQSLGGGYDAFVAQFDPTQKGGASLSFSSFLGGFLTDIGRGITVDAAGRIYVVGSTLATDFPVTFNAYSPSYLSGGDAFLTQIDPNAGTILYSTYLGGSGGDVATNVIVEPSGNVAVAGYTSSSDLPLTFNAAQPAYGGNGDAFVMSLNLAAQSRASMLVYSTYYGGNDSEVSYGLSRDPAGRYVIAGYTLSQNLPVSAGAVNPQSIGQNVDGFLAVLDPAASLTYGSYITGPGYQYASALATDSAGNAYVVGLTTSDIFSHGPIKPNEPGNIDAFLTIVAPAAASGQVRERIDVFSGNTGKLKTDPVRQRKDPAFQ